MQFLKAQGDFFGGQLSKIQIKKNKKKQKTVRFERLEPSCFIILALINIVKKALLSF